MTGSRDLPLVPEARHRDWLTPVEVSERTGIALQTLANWRVDGKGPRFRKLTRKIVAYPLEEVLAWERSHPLLQASSEWEPKDG